MKKASYLLEDIESKGHCSWKLFCLDLTCDHILIRTVYFTRKTSPVSVSWSELYTLRGRHLIYVTMSVEIVDTAAVELPLICRNSSAMVRCSSVRSILSSTTSVHSAVSNSEIGTSALVCGGSGNTLVHSVVGADTLVSGHSVNTLVNSAIGSDPVVRCSSVSSLGSEDEGFICASTPVTKVSHHTQVNLWTHR